MSIRAFHYLWMSGLVCLLPSCVDNKVAEYPLPRHGGSISNTIASDIQNPATIGNGIGDPAATPNMGDIPVLPGATNPVQDNAQMNMAAGGSNTVAPTPNTGNTAQPNAAPAGSKAKYPYAIRIPGETDYVLSPYDNRKIKIRREDGRLISSGKVIRAEGETDPNRKFIIP